MKVFFNDNFDSFTFNLVDEFEKRGCEVIVYRNNISFEKIKQEINKLQPQLIVISPGPGSPANAGNSIPLIKEYHGKISIFGVCLGMQSIVECFGGEVSKCKETMHGKSSKVTHDESSIFKNLPQNFLVGRYHSLSANRLPDSLKVFATVKDDDIVMAVKHEHSNTVGVQFHPESILTPVGGQIIENVIKEAKND
jgi:anthranilate synthase/aminodeoxychorismate synthase-like glutamine amidotransferase